MRGKKWNAYNNETAAKFVIKVDAFCKLALHDNKQECSFLFCMFTVLCIDLINIFSFGFEENRFRK